MSQGKKIIVIVSLEIPLLSLTDLEAGCVDHGDVGTQGVAEEVSSAEKTPIIVTLLELFTEFGAV